MTAEPITIWRVASDDGDRQLIDTREKLSRWTRRKTERDAASVAMFAFRFGVGLVGKSVAREGWDVGAA